MLIEAGKYYKTRDGRKVGPVRENGGFNGVYPLEVEGFARWIKPNGVVNWGMGFNSADDLVAEWTEGPVREVTRKEIVSGLYGHVEVRSLKGVSDVSVGVRLHSTMVGLKALTATELRAAAATFLELADALESA